MKREGYDPSLFCDIKASLNLQIESIGQMFISFSERKPRATSVLHSIIKPQIKIKYREGTHSC